MNILQIGKAKSGNFWLYKIIQNILQEANIHNSGFLVNHSKYKEIRKLKLSTEEQNSKDVIDIDNDGIYFRVSSVFKEKITDFDAYLRHATHVWSHSRVSKNTEYAFNNFDKIIYIIRDPRDVLLSMGNFVLSDYMKHYYPNKYKNQNQYVQYNLLTNCRSWHYHVSDYLRLNYNNLYIIFYENLLSDFDAELDSLLSFLGIHLPNSSKSNIKTNCDAEVMKMANPGHVHVPKIYKWKHKLSENQIEKVSYYIKNTLYGLNYNIYKNEKTKFPYLRDLSFCNEFLKKIDSNLIYEKVLKKLMR